MKKQRGVSDIIGVFALCGIFAFVLSVVSCVKENDNEISVKNYEELNALAEQTCEGQSYLKERVKLGPILGSELDDATNHLNKLINDKSKADIKAKIVGGTGAGSCQS